MTQKPAYPLDIRQILQILPHRYPFLLVDRVVDLDVEGRKIVGQKNVTMNEPFFQGHFPERPIMPGVLILEAMAQTGGVLLNACGYSEGKIALFLTINDAKFRRAVMPGDTLMLHVEGKVLSSKGGKIYGRAMVDNQVTTEAEIGYALVNRSEFIRE